MNKVGKFVFFFPTKKHFPPNEAHARYTREELNINEHLNTKNFYTLRVNHFLARFTKYSTSFRSISCIGYKP